jgi:endonuclease G
MTPMASALLLLAAASAAAFAQYDRFGAPPCPVADHEIADRTYFVLCYSAARKVPLWVGYELSADKLTRVASRPSHFRRDRGLTLPGAVDADYRNSGFSRGHMAPAADFAWSSDAMAATYLLSNVVPQRQRVNAGPWAAVEAAVRRIAAASDEVYVFTGPIFDAHNTETIDAGVAVPTHTYKVVLAIRAGRRSMFAAIVPNIDAAAVPAARFVTSVAEVEHRTGLDFFASLEDAEERELEAAATPGPSSASSR